MPAGRRAATARVSTVRGAMCRAICAGAPWCSATPAALTRCELAPLRCRGRGSKPTPAPGIHQAHARWASGVCAGVFQGVGRRSATRGGPHAQSSQDSFQVGFHQIVVDALRRFLPPVAASWCIRRSTDTTLVTTFQTQTAGALRQTLNHPAHPRARPVGLVYKSISNIHSCKQQRRLLPAFRD